MTIRGEFGEPLEQIDNPILYDWCDRELYQGDVIYITDYGFVSIDDDLQEFMKQHFDIMTVEQYLETRSAND